MRKIVIPALVLLSVYGCLNRLGKNAELPEQIKKYLDENYPKWEIVKMPAKVYREARENGYSVPGNIVCGDFDGNNQQDWAVYILFGKNDCAVIAFLKKGSDYDKHILHAYKGCIPFTFITVFKKGEKDEDWENNMKEFIYPNDSIFYGLWETCGSSYIFDTKAKKFFRVCTAD